MQKLRLLFTVLCLVLVVVPATVVGAEPEDAVTVTVTGDGTWSDSCWFVNLYPGETQTALFEFHNSLDIPVHVNAYADPCCLDGGEVTACFCHSEFTLPASGNYTVCLNVTAGGDAVPGVHSIQITIETDTEIPDPDLDPDPDPDPDLDLDPYRMVLTSVYTSRVVGEPHEVSAVLYSEGDEPIAGASVSWTLPSGSAGYTTTESVTDSTGTAKARVVADAPGSAVVRCASTADSEVSATVIVVWVAAANGGDPDPDPEPESGGIPGWAVFLIVLAAMAAVWGVVIVVRRRRATSLEEEQEPWEDETLPKE